MAKRSGWEGFTQEWLDKRNESQNKNLPGGHGSVDPVIQKPKKNNRTEQDRDGRKNKKKSPGDYIEARRSVFVGFRHNDRKERDDDGNFSTILDSMVHAGVLPNDSNKDVARSASASSYEKQPGADIVIIEFED